MATFRVDDSSLGRLASALSLTIDDLAPSRGGAHRIMVEHGFSDEAYRLQSGAAATVRWAESWALSLLARRDILSGLAPVDTAGARDNSPAHTSTHQVLHGVPFAGRGPAAASRLPLGGDGEPPGVATATELLDALEAGDLETIAAVIERVTRMLTDPLSLADFFSVMGPDITGLLPQLLVDVGATPDELPGLVTPVAQALGVAVGNTQVDFDGADLMDGHEGRGITPAIYFDFGSLPLPFLRETSVGVLAPFGSEELPLEGLDYPLGDEATSTADPRLPLLRAVLRLEVDAQRAFLAGLAEDGLLEALVAPTTPWGDDGEAAGALLAALGTEQEMGETAAGLADLLSEPPHPLSPGVVAGIAAGIVSGLVAPSPGITPIVGRTTSTP